MGEAEAGVRPVVPDGGPPAPPVAGSRRPRGAIAGQLSTANSLLVAGMPHRASESSGRGYHVLARTVCEVWQRHPHAS